MLYENQRLANSVLSWKQEFVVKTIVTGVAQQYEATYAKEPKIVHIANGFQGDASKLLFVVEASPWYPLVFDQSEPKHRKEKKHPCRSSP